MSLSKIMKYSGKKYNGIPIEILIEHHKQKVQQSINPNGTLEEALQRQREYFEEVYAWQSLEKYNKKIEEENQKKMESAVSAAVEEILKGLDKDISVNIR